MGFRERLKQLSGVDELRAVREQVTAISEQVAALAVHISHLQAQIDQSSVRRDERASELDQVLRGVQDYLIAITPMVVVTHDHILTTKDRLKVLTEQMAAEREAGMASDDGVRRQLTTVTELLHDLAVQRGAARTVTGLVDELQQARSMIEIARSQYRDPLPSDANEFARVEP